MEYVHLEIVSLRFVGDNILLDLFQIALLMYIRPTPLFPVFLEVGQLFSQAVIGITVRFEDITHFPGEIVTDSFLEVSECWLGVYRC